MIGWPKIGWKGRLSLTGWILGTLTLVFLAYQWLPIFTLGLLSFSGPTGGTTFPMNGTSFHWYQEVWRATVMNDFKPPLVRSSLLALACSATTIVLSVMAAQAMRGQFRGNGWFFYLMLLGIMAPGILVGFGFAIMMRLMGVELSWDTTTFLVQVSWTLPFGFLTMLAVFNRFDKKVEEAALTLGRFATDGLPPHHPAARPAGRDRRRPVRLLALLRRIRAQHVHHRPRRHLAARRHGPARPPAHARDLRRRHRHHVLLSRRRDLLHPGLLDHAAIDQPQEIFKRIGDRTC